MPSQTMQQLEELAVRTFSDPMTGDSVRQELQAIAASDPSHPMPPIAQAIILGMGRKDINKMKEFLAQAAALLRMDSDRSTSEEWKIARMLYEALSAEVILVEYRPVWGSTQSPEDVALREQAAAKVNELLTRLEQIVREGEDMDVFRVLVAALRSLSLANAPDSNEVQSGIAVLKNIWEVSNATLPLAAYFLIFAYRRVHKVDDALRVASTLLDRYPRGIIPKLVLASTQAANCNYLEAELLVREVSEILPPDPWLTLGRAVMLRRANRMNEARSVLDRVQVHPQQARLKALVDMENRLMRLRVTIPPIP